MNRISVPLIFIASLVISSCNESSSASDKALLATISRLQDRADTEYIRGEEKWDELKEVTEDRSAPVVQKRSIRLLKPCEEINKRTQECITMIEYLKTKLFKSFGEDMSAGPESILASKWSPKEPFHTSYYKLQRVQNGGSTDLISYTSSKGRELVKCISSFRNQLCATIAASSSTDEQQYFFNPPSINSYVDGQDLYNQIDRAVMSSHVSPDDSEMIKKIYMSLTHRIEDWQMMLPENCDWHTAFGTLLTLQTDLLAARADAITVIRQRVTGCGYSFDRILAIANGPEAVKAGAEFNIEVLMAAFDSDKQPIVKVTGGQLKVTRDGKGIVHVKAPKGASEFVVAGTITILNKSGIPKTLPWEKRIAIVK